MSVVGGFLFSSVIEPIRMSISATTANVNLFTLAGSPSSARDYIFTVESGVDVYSNTYITPALRTGVFPAGSTLTLINLGRILGGPGTGGAGNSAGSGSPGGAGGTAIQLDYSLSVDNTSGYIFGGGGGGGGGGSSGRVDTGGGGE